MQWRLLAVLAAMLGLVLVNPYGADYPRYLVRGLFMPRPRIVEWEPMWSDPGVLGALAVALMVALYAIRKIGWRNAPGALIVLVCAVAALRHVRHSNIFAVAWLCYVPGWLARTPLAAAIDAFWRRKARAVAAASVLVGAFCMILMLSKSPWRLDIPVMPKGAHYHGLLYPAGAVEYLKQQHFHGNVMTTYGSGSFVSWHLYPAVKVSLDSRYEVAYQPGVMEEICDFYDAKGLWQRTLEKYPTDLLLAPVKEKVTGLLATTDWKCVYRDDVFRLYARRGLQLPVINREGQKLVGTFP
jgi:hypothetical protein